MFQQASRNAVIKVRAECAQRSKNMKRDKSRERKRNGNENKLKRLIIMFMMASAERLLSSF